MSKNAWSILAIAIAAATLTAPGASAATLKYEGGPVMSSARWVEVVWGSGFATENAGLPEYVASYLTDDAADSGKTTNVFAIDTQYSTPSQVLAYNQGFAGSVEIAPAKCGGATTCSLEESEIEAELANQIAGGKIPAPAGNGMGTAYVVVFPASITIHDSTGAQSGATWCAEHGSTLLSGGRHLIFAMVPDLGSSGGCGALAHPNDNVILSVSHQQSEMLTDPLVTEEELGWYDANSFDSPGYGEIADICVTAGVDYGEESINGHKWFVQNEWSNADGKCEASTKDFNPPTADFTAAASVNTATFSASGASTNHLGVTYPAAIAGYSWDFGDGQTGTGASPSHSYAAGGAYRVTLTATDTLGFTATASHEVTVSSPPQPGPITTGGSPQSIKPTVKGGAGATTASTSGLINTGQTVSCPLGGGLCVVTIKGEVQSAHLSTHKAKSRKIVVGNATITIPAGASAKVTFKLNATGKKLLQTHKHLAVKVTITVRQGTATVVSTRTINVKAPKPHGRRR